jgi:hypothetical protein
MIDYQLLQIIISLLQLMISYDSLIIVIVTFLLREK